MKATEVGCDGVRGEERLSEVRRINFLEDFSRLVLVSTPKCVAQRVFPARLAFVRRCVALLALAGWIGCVGLLAAWPQPASADQLCNFNPNSAGDQWYGCASSVESKQAPTKTPPPPNCDCNGDGKCNQADLACDCNGDGKYDEGDAQCKQDPQCDSSPQQCCPDNSAPQSEPISSHSGQETLRVTDLRVEGVFPIEITRRYDNQSTYDSPLGYGWSLNYDLRLFTNPDGSVAVRKHCGGMRTYALDGGSFQYTGSGVRVSALARLPDGTYKLSPHSGGMERHESFFDAQGRLTAIEDVHGNRLEFTYDARGKLPLVGTSPFSVTPTRPFVAAKLYRLVKIEERLASSALTGRYVTLSYDESTGRLDKVESYDGRIVDYDHDVAAAGLTTGNLVRAEGPYLAGSSGMVWTHAYTDARFPHALTSTQMGEGTLPYLTSYDVQNRAVRQQHGLHEIEMAYDVTPCAAVKCRQQKTIVKDASGATQRTVTRRYEFNAKGYRTKLIDEAGSEFRTTYDATTNQVLSESVYRKQGSTLVLEAQTTYTYSPEGLLLTQTDSAPGEESRIQEWTYDHGWKASHTQAMSDRPGEVIRAEWIFDRENDDDNNPAARPIAIKEERHFRDATNYEATQFGYANGRRTGTTLPGGVVIQRAYYPETDAQISRRGLLKKVYQEIGGVEDVHQRMEFDYDAAGRVSVVRDARDIASGDANQKTTLVRDAKDRIVLVANSLGEQALYTYGAPDAAGANVEGEFLKEIEIGRVGATAGLMTPGLSTRFVVDAMGNTTAVERKDASDAWVRLQTLVYDSLGNLLAETDAAGNMSRREYGLLERLTAVVDAKGHRTVFAYNARGQRLSVTNPDGRTMAYARDALGRVTREEWLNVTPAEVVAYQYDGAGNLRTVTDAKSHTTVYGYDGLSRLTSVTQPGGQIESYAYDDRGRLSEVRDA